MSERLKKLYLEKALFFMGIISMPSMYYLDFERLSNLPHIAFMPLMQSIIWISIFPFNFIQSTIVSSVPFLTSLTLLVNYDSISFTLYIFLYFFPHILLVSNKWKSEKESRSNFLKTKKVDGHKKIEQFDRTERITYQQVELEIPDKARIDWYLKGEGNIYYAPQLVVDNNDLN